VVQKLMSSWLPARYLYCVMSLARGNPK
jgi:hypothetical protein